MNCLAHQKKNAQPLDVNLCLKKDAIFKLPRPHLGQVAYATDTEETYIYGQDGWQVFGDVKVNGEGLKMSLYDLNRSIMEQLPALTDYDTAINTINAFEKKTYNAFYMLYGKDISYFTIFKMQNAKYENYECESLGDAVLECLENVGVVKTIDMTDEGTVEIWMDINGEIHCLYLFPYDTGVVTVKGE